MDERGTHQSEEAEGQGESGMKAQNIQAFAGDSMSVSVAVYDERNQPYILADNHIETARMVLPKAGIEVDGEMSGNVCRFWIDEGKTEAGTWDYYIFIVGSKAKFTVAYGKALISRLPE